MSIIFVFLDGVGLAAAGPDNPLADADTPTFRSLLGGPLTIEQTRSGAMGMNDLSPSRVGHPSWQLLLKAIDATLGVDGLPQSGTGQTALLAGVNAAALHGRHQPHVPPVALRSLLAEQNIFQRVAARGGRATFANPFGPGYWQALAARRLRRSASMIAATGADLRFRDGDDLRNGRAVSWDVTNAAMRARDIGAPLVTPAQAGANLARLADNHDLVFYESFLPDLAGHGRLTTEQGDGLIQQDGIAHSPVEAQIRYAIGLLDRMIGGTLGAMRATDTLIMTSDHGNVESLAAPTHTRNPVPLLAIGPAARGFAEVASIAEVADAIEQAIWPNERYNS